MASTEELLASASWVSGPIFDYGPDDLGCYDWHRNHVVSATFHAGEKDLASGVHLALAVLGYARVLVNGVALPSVELLGHWTRFDKLVYYDVLDLTEVVRAGENEIEVELGNAFYNPSPLTLFGKYNLRERLAEAGTPAVLAVVAAAGRVLAETGKGWHAHEGRLLFNNLYLGEVCDLGPAPEGELALRAVPNERALAPAPVSPCRRFGRVAPRSVEETAEGLLVDFGEIVAGTVDLRFAGRAGQRVTLTYAEVAEGGRIRVDSNVAGLVGMETPRGVCPGGPGAPEVAVQRDVLLAKEGENAYVSTFTYHSFRYVLVEGLGAAELTSVEAVYVHTDLAQSGRLETGNAAYDALLDAAVRTKLNNVHGIWEDCSRERFGYGGDMVSLSHSNFMVLQEEGLLDKTLADFRLDQTPRGGLPETAPFMGIGSNGPAYGEGPLLWQLAYPYLAVMADRYYGRSDLIEREWDGIARFGSYLLSFDPGELAGHCLGDHGSILTGGAEGFKSGTPDKDFVGWCAILWGLLCVADAGARIGRDATGFEAAAEGLRARIRARFARPDGSFGDGTQTSCAFAGMLGLADPALQAELLAADFRARGGVLTTGIFGTMLAFDLLHRTGHDDVVEAWLMRKEHPSLLSMLATGNGTLAEQFTEDLSSYDHAMFSSYAQWLFQALGGIRVADDAVGANRLVVAPYFSPLTEGVTCSYVTPHGEVLVRWRREGGEVALEVTVPDGVTVV